MSARLNDKKVRTATAGRYYDGGGLILRVRESGSRDWALRITKDGKTSDYGLGGYPLVSLAEARDSAYLLRKDIKLGNTPTRANKVENKNFQELSEQYIAAHAPSWKSPKSKAQWESSLTNYVYSKIGKKYANEITTTDVLSILKPIWESKNETASRVRGRIEKILDSASAQGLRSGDNPARWQGHLITLLPKPSLVSPVEHFAAMDYRNLPKFWQDLTNVEGISSAALRWTILNVARSGETRGASYNEISNGLWIIPASRMKAGKEHRVPISKSAQDIIDSGNVVKNSLIFPSPRGGTLSDMSLSAILKRMKITNVTVHGFRSTFRDWAGEATSHPREVIEHALAHQLKNKSEAAYARSDLLEKRRKLMNDWAAFVTGEAT